MRNNAVRKLLGAVCALMLFAVCAAAQEHKWAGRNLSEFEWAIHERLAAIPSHGVFDDIRFEVQGDTVVLTGQVLRESVKLGAERAVRRVAGVRNVANRIEVLPESPRDAALRMNVYRAVYENRQLDKYGTREAPSIQIVVKGGWVSLEGTVDSDEDRAAAHLQALKVTSHVSDNLRVVPRGI